MGCAGRVLAALGLLAIVGVAWLRGPEIRERMAPEREPSDLEAVEAVATRALEGYRAVLGGEADRWILTAEEVEGLLRTEAGDRLPVGSADVGVRLVDGEARIDLQVAFELLPELVELERVRGVLPDRIPLTLRGTLLTLDETEAVLVVRRVDAVGVPIPRALFPAALGPLGSDRRAELPPEALPVPLPTGIGSAYIDGDRLVLLESP